MMVRCGACRTQFDAPGPGRYSCPACGSVNMIRDQGGGAPPPQPTAGGYPTAPGVQGGQATPPPPPSERPVPKIKCPECDFEFHVGEVARVVCPMCSAEVRTGIVDDSDEDNGTDKGSEEE